MSSATGDEDLDIEMPKMRTANKPKNLKKRKRDVEDAEQDSENSKKTKAEEDADEVEVNKLEETRILQQARAGRVRGSDMSSEDVRLSSASGGDGEGESIASLNTHFTGQRAKINVLDTRLEEYIDREMAKRKAERAGQPETGVQEAPLVEEEVKKEPEVDEDEEAEKQLHDLNTRTTQAHSGSSSTRGDESMAKGPQSSNVIDLSNAKLRATSSVQTAAQTDAPAKRHYRQDGPTTTSGILEIDLPVEEQLRMYEATRQAALEAVRNQRRRRPTHERDEFGDLDVSATGVAATGGNISVDFSKHKKHVHSGNRATDMDALDKYKKRQASMHR